jgi:hypothetical protein
MAVIARSAKGADEAIQKKTDLDCFGGSADSQ